MLKRSFAAALGIVVSLAAGASAQSFGHNKVQYDQFRFEILETPHFDVHYYAEERQAALIAARLAERWYDRLSVTFDHTFDRRQPIILYASHSHFTQTSILPGSVPEGVGGFTDHLAGRVVLPFAAGLGETDHVLGHEIVHAFQRDILKKNGQSIAALPLWFTEGMAEYLSLDELGSNTRMWLRDAVNRGKLPTLAELDNPRWFPYRYGQVLWTYLEDAYGEPVIRNSLLAKPGKSGAIGRLERVTGHDADALAKGWQEYIRGVAGAITPLPKPRAEEFRPVSGEIVRSTGVNLAPALSPDGRYLVFLSDADGYSVDVFVANSRSGQVERKLLSTATDPHSDSLQFINSAGAWSPTGDRFALATVRRGRPAITIFAMPQGDVLHEYDVATLDQIYTPTWAPDGDQLAFTGMRGGFSDLYVMSLPDGTTKPLTSDPFSDLQPTWSPDGKHLAFSTDRFTSSISNLTFGRYLIGSVDVDSGEIEFLGGSNKGKSIDPQWCPDGTCLYFVSDADGVNNVYRLEMDTRQAARLTSVVTGVSGITSLSPSISLGDEGKRLAYAVYSRGRYEIRITYLPPAVRTATFRRGAAEPGADVVAEAVNGDASTSSGPQSFTARRYSSRLSLFSVGQPYMTANGGASGTYLRAGISLSATDLLGQQKLGLGVQAGRRAGDVVIETSYLNRRRRWNWGVEASQVPWVTGISERTRSTSMDSGEPLLVHDANVDRQLHRQVSGLLVYPFSRAQRIETSVGIDSVTLSREVTKTTFLPDPGPTSQPRIDAPIARSAASAVSSVSLVHDTTVYGATSPVLGERYRVRLLSSAGDLTLVTAAGDYRRYYSPVRGITLAARAQQVMRFGPSANDERLLPLVLTAHEVVRGFRHDEMSERASTLSSLNLEVRTPLSRLLRGRLASDTLPVELFGFTDVARFSGPRSLFPTERVRQLWSTGGGARVNAAGFVLELNAVRPQSELQRDWRFVVNFRPGF